MKRILVFAFVILISAVLAFAQYSVSLKSNFVLDTKIQDIIITKKAIGTIEGEVYYPDGKKRVIEALINAYKDDNHEGRIPSFISDENGQFNASLEVGSYTICAWKQSENYLLPNVLPFGLPVGGKCEEINIIAGQKTYIRLNLAPKSGFLEGQIEQISPNISLTDIKVTLYRPLNIKSGKWELTSPKNATWIPKVEKMVSFDGKFRIEGLPSGIYFLKAEAKSGNVWYYNKMTSEENTTPIQIYADKTNRVLFKLN
jgi:hypothetical protein